MKNIKKYIALLCIAAMFILTACGQTAAPSAENSAEAPAQAAPAAAAEAEESPAEPEVMPAADPFKDGMQLGSSDFKITGLASFSKLGSIKGDFDDSFIGFYGNEAGNLGMDVYQFSREGKSLEDYAKEECEECSGTDLRSEEYNGFKVMAYNAVESYEGVECPTVTYITVFKGDFVELVFWVNEDNYEDAVDIMNSLATLETQEIVFGATPYKLTIHEFFENRTAEGDVFPDKSHQAYYHYSRGLSIDIFGVDAEYIAGRTLEKYAEEEAAKLNKGTFRMGQVGDIPFACYSGIAEYPNGKVLDTDIYVLEDGESFVEICFAKFSVVGNQQVDDIMSTLKK